MQQPETRSGRTPDLTLRCGRISVVGWLDDSRGWSLQLSRSYSHNEETRYEQMRLYPSDLPLAITLLEKATDQLITPHS